MNKRQFYFEALNAGAHLSKAWVLSAFSVTRIKNPEAYSIIYEQDRTSVMLPDGEGLKQVVLEDVPVRVPVYRAMEPLEVFAGEVPNLSKDVQTTYGDVLFNWRVLVYAFGSKFDYVVGPVKIKSIEKAIAQRLMDDPEPGAPEDESSIYVRDYIKFGTAVADLAAFAQLFVPTATAKSLQTDPAVHQRRAELLEQHKDQLHNPVVIAGIQQELVKMDKEWLKDDPSEGFFVTDKVWNTARKRMFLIHGPEAGFDEGGDAELVVNSLNEGWDISKLPAMINSLRAGSYYRGKLTALGGESVKFYMRVFQNTRISQEDCGSRMGLTKRVEHRNRSNLIGTWIIHGKGDLLLTEENIDQFIGQTVEARSPMYCLTPNSDFCERCMGSHNSERPNGLSSAASEIGSTFMSIMMASAHAKEIRAVDLLHETFLT